MVSTKHSSDTQIKCLEGVLQDYIFNLIESQQMSKTLLWLRASFASPLRLDSQIICSLLTLIRLLFSKKLINCSVETFDNLEMYGKQEFHSDWRPNDSMMRCRHCTHCTHCSPPLTQICPTVWHYDCYSYLLLERGSLMDWAELVRSYRRSANQIVNRIVRLENIENWEKAELLCGREASWLSLPS